MTVAGCGGDSSRGGGHSRNELDCMMRAIFFEANRSSREGMIAVGSVVMNRVESPEFPNTVCGVVGQKGQFAPGIMTRPMESKALPDVREAAIAVLRGERQPGVQNAMFFHTQGYSFPYDNMHYVLVAGGNAFYEKRRSHLVTQPVPPTPIERRRGY
nr:cell wall hydrolase [Paracoccus caeni]